MVRSSHGSDGEAVVLVHGLWLSGWAMALIAHWLRTCGFHTHVFSYPSVGHSLRDNAAALRAFSDTLGADTVHYVGHSLGGVVIRAMLHYYPSPRAGRVVTLGSPHSGSSVARALSRQSWGRRFLGLSIADLLRGEPPLKESPAYAFGLIKGDLPIGLGALLFGLERPSDGVVSIAETSLPGAADETTLRIAHTAMLLSRKAAMRTCEFLRQGHFAH